MKVLIHRIILPLMSTAGFCLVPTIVNGQGDAALVTVTEVVAEDMSPVVPAAGTVFSRNVTQITSGLAGRIEWIAEPGDFVAAGEPVARFDCDMLELRREEQLAQAEREEINHEILRVEAERLEKARESLVASETQLALMRGDRDLAASDLRIVRVRIRQTEAELKRCVATAPFGGVVTERFRNAGEDVERSTVLAAMTDTRNLEVRASVPIRHMPRIRTGDFAEIRMSEFRFEGRIRKAVPAGDALSQTFQVRIDLPEGAQDVIAAGQLVSVSLPLSAARVMTVPRDPFNIFTSNIFAILGLRSLYFILAAYMQKFRYL